MRQFSFPTHPTPHFQHQLHLQLFTTSLPNTNLTTIPPNLTHMPKSIPLTAPPTPIALQAHHLLSPPPDLLTNTATTLSISQAQLEDTPTCTFTVNLLHTHEPPDSPERQVPLYTVHNKPWPSGHLICNTDETPLLLLRRAWLSGARKWSARPPTGKDILEASMPWAGRPGKSTGARLDVRFVNALRESKEPIASDEPPPYSAAPGGANIQEKQASGSEGSALPSYESVRRDSPNPLRDLLDAVEPPREPMPAVLGSESGVGLGGAGVSVGSKVELRVLQLGVSGTGVMMGDRMIIRITRYNSMDYSRSKAKLTPGWEAEVAEGVDLLLAVSIVLIMTESVSRNKWK